jgi:hypothetical protein
MSHPKYLSGSNIPGINDRARMQSKVVMMNGRIAFIFTFRTNGLLNFLDTHKSIHFYLNKGLPISLTKGRGAVRHALRLS